MLAVLQQSGIGFVHAKPIFINHFLSTLYVGWLELRSQALPAKAKFMSTGGVSKVSTTVSQQDSPRHAVVSIHALQIEFRTHCRVTLALLIFMLHGLSTSITAPSATRLLGSEKLQQLRDLVVQTSPPGSVAFGQVMLMKAIQYGG
jgi:hypothetical protein